MSGIKFMGLPSPNKNQGLPWWVQWSVHETQETRVRPLGWEASLEKEMATTPVFSPGKSRGQRGLTGYSPQGCKESDMTQQLEQNNHKKQTAMVMSNSCVVSTMRQALFQMLYPY